MADGFEREGGLTRRTLIGAAAAGAAGAAVPSAADAARRKRKHTRRRRGVRRLKKRKVDVAVVGAGLAGLTAARELVSAGHSVAVLEARDRVGGRTWTREFSGAPVDLGGQWLGPQQQRMAALAEAVGVDTFPTYNSGENVFFRSGSRSTYTGAIPTGDPAALPDIALVLQKLNDMAKTVPVDAPWTAGNAVEWDGQTMETWKLDNAVTPGGRFLTDLGVQAVWACEPRDVSLLHILFYIASAGSFENLINVANGAQESRFVGGAQRVSAGVASALGRRVVTRSPVRRIVQGRRRARVESDRMIVQARRVIVALAPTLAGRIEYRPGLPALRDQLTQRVPMGSVIKIHAVYDSPFWREDGLTGQATSDAGPVKITFDNSPPDGSPGVLLGFIEGQEARIWGRRHAAERRQAVLDSFARYFGPRASSPRDYVEMNWGEERWSRGCYVGYTPPGVLLDYGTALREPIGRVHWAGTETATIWNGYMDGAVQSGERAAAEVIAAL